MVVIGLGKNLLLKSVLGHCGIALNQVNSSSPFLAHSVMAHNCQCRMNVLTVDIKQRHISKDLVRVGNILIWNFQVGSSSLVIGLSFK